MLNNVCYWMACVGGSFAGAAMYVLCTRSDIRFDPRWLPAVLVVINVAAAIGYGVTGGAEAWRKVVYWLAAATLTGVVTW